MNQETIEILTVPPRQTTTLETIGFIHPIIQGQKKRRRRTKKEIMEGNRVRCPKCKHEWYQVRG